VNKAGKERDQMTLPALKLQRKTDTPLIYTQDVGGSSPSPPTSLLASGGWNQSDKNGASRRRSSFSFVVLTVRLVRGQAGAVFFHRRL
jgi:hypothetical protein